MAPKKPVPVTKLPPIDEVIQKGKKKLDKPAVAGKIPVHCNLAPTYGNLLNESSSKMNDNLVTMIAVTLLKMNKLEDRSWPKLMSTMMTNLSIIPESNPPGIVIKTYSQKGDSWFKYKDEEDKTVIKQVEVWFTNLIHDVDVLDDTRIDNEFLAKMVASCGVAITNFQSFFYGKKTKYRKMVDVGVLRFPDISKPYFLLYRIEIRAWVFVERILAYTENRSGILGTYQKIRFNPREELIAGLKKKVLKIAQDTVSNMLLDL